ncbi:MAG TPA: phytanoyl-CoA dioxygenase family protein [Acidimicrobiales bacterium]|nr:phytanoyl-CoA dioxygenase family protein [Acidimicrobiales bacterium]
MSVDVRTRKDATSTSVDPVSFLETTLPAAFAAAADRLDRWLKSHDLRPLVIDVDEGPSVTLAVEAGRVAARPVGAAADGARLRLTAEQLGDLVADQVTPIGWMASGALVLEGARFGELLDWWLVVRAALDGTTPYLAGDVELCDATGAPLDLQRSFQVDDDPDEMAHFLHTAGYLHLAGVFSADEMAAISADMDRAAPGYSQGDGRSWWARLHDGTDALVRMQRFEAESQAAATLIADERIVGLGRLTGDGHEPPTGVEALFKSIGVAEGISDIPWHKDCSLGRHSYICSRMTVGISVTGADATSGRLAVVAGSHRGLVWPAPELQPGLDLPVVPLATATGDCTVHLSCALHMAQPPVERPRRVLYTDLSLPVLDEATAAAGAARLRQIREAAPLTVSQPASTVGV